MKQQILSTIGLLLFVALIAGYGAFEHKTKQVEGLNQRNKTLESEKNQLIENLKTSENATQQLIAERDQLSTLLIEQKRTLTAIESRSREFAVNQSREQHTNESFKNWSDGRISVDAERLLKHRTGDHRNCRHETRDDPNT